ncbi:phenylacetate--CoA ligase family protein [Desulfosoma sp.]|uniref:phenylacetate--CoA ligase family protein n=1 Tax=Desulfosoma sp. TaxID=2603217 RepID=UPI00404B484A
MHPRLVRKVIFPLHEKIVGRKTFAYLKSLEKEQWLSPQALNALKAQKLKDLLVHAQRNIPFYARRCAEAGFDPEKMTGIEDLQKLPLLTKAEIRKNLRDMLWKDCPGGLHRYNTGGSTGEPLVFYFDRRRQAYDAAARAMSHRWWGIDIGDRELYLWGSPLEITRQDRIKDLRDALTNQLLLSAFEISEKNVPGFVAKMRRFKPDCVFGYPSTIDLFCRMAERQGYRLDGMGVRVVFCTAEVLYAHQRQSISEAFGGIPVVDSYGSREGGFVNHQCPEGSYHVMDSNYIIEFLKDGSPVGPSESGEVTLTHLDAWGMPLIRYRTGDMAAPGDGRCRCGRGFSTMSQVQGRTTDFVVTPDGRWQHGLSVIYVVRDIEGVDQFKIVQEDYDDVRVFIKVYPELYPSDGDERIVRGFQKRMGSMVRVSVHHVEDIPRETSGKYRYVVSRVAQWGLPPSSGVS